jgi:phosphatidylglycerol:prolipoprotein diacylglycerol transferase
LAIVERQLIYPEYALSVLLALMVGAFFPVMQEMRESRLRRQYVKLQIVTLIGAAIGCKLAVLFGESGWPFVRAEHLGAVLLSGRSILGALIFGLLAAEVAKPILGYPLPPNDRFAAVLPFTLAIGRVGCLLHGCCRGVAWDGWCAITYSDGIPRHAIPAYEIIFDVAVGMLFVWMVRRHIARGHLFSIFLILYGGFRFATEFIRETPKLYGGVISGYQVLACAAALLGAAFIVKRARRTHRRDAENAGRTGESDINLMPTSTPSGLP